MSKRPARVCQRADRLQHRPALALTHPQKFCNLPHGTGDRLGIDGREILAFPQPGTKDGITVPDLRDKMHVGNFAERVG